MELDNSRPRQAKKSKKLRHQDSETGEKKRKRPKSDDDELASPTKKHRSNHQSNSSNQDHIPLAASEVPTKSSFFQQTSSLYLPLPPISQSHALKGLCAEHLSPLILTYYPPFHGVVVSYSNCRLSTDSCPVNDTPCAKAIDEYAASFIWLTAEFIVFRPQKGDVIEGWINLQNESNIGLLCLNFFNATIGRKRLSKEWKWVTASLQPPRKKWLKKAVNDASTDSDQNSEDERGGQEHDPEDAQGCFRDADGNKIEGLTRFTVKNVETSRGMDRETGFLNIEGTMLRDEEERDLREEEKTQSKRKGKE